MIRAITLISGGLDSLLAARLIQLQGIEVIPLSFEIPFCGLRNHAGAVTKILGVDIKVINLADDFLEVIKNPRYGFGSNMNPCIDCKILMLSRAKELMQQVNAAFLVTGEVLGQRPMSQNKQALKTIEKRAGLEGLVLRPLSARLLPETIAEKEGWVRRDKLLNFNGRSRKPQIELAKELEVKGYAQPAGGCLLTDPEFARRLKDILNRDELNLENIELLKIGRHFRISRNTKLVVGRDERENGQLENLAKEGDYLFMPQDTAGPTALGRGNFNAELINLSCGITGRYCDRNGKAPIGIVYKKAPRQEEKLLEVFPLEEAEIKSLRI